MRNDEKSYGNIAVALNITRHLCNYEINVNKKIRGLKQKIFDFNVYRLYVEIWIIKISGITVTTTKLIVN